MSLDRADVRFAGPGGASSGNEYRHPLTAAIDALGIFADREEEDGPDVLRESTITDLLTNTSTVYGPKRSLVNGIAGYYEKDGRFLSSSREVSWTLKWFYSQAYGLALHATYEYGKNGDIEDFANILFCGITRYEYRNNIRAALPGSGTRKYFKKLTRKSNYDYEKAEKKRREDEDSWIRYKRRCGARMAEWWADALSVDSDSD